MSHSSLAKYLRISVTAALLILVLMFRNVSAATTDYTISVTYDQTGARSMLSMVNDFRTGPDAWYYKSNGSVYTCSGLSGYTYDYNLEQIAMQRACEIAVCFDHVRPDGSSCFTATCNGTRSYGENIAAGTRSASATFTLWQETNSDYSGQGHRRAMLDSSFTAIGIAHVEYRGVHFWVQEFGYSNSGAAVTPVNDSTVDKTITVNQDYATLNTVLSSSSMTIYMDQDSVALPTVTANIKVEEGWGTAGIILDPSEYTLSWAISDPNIATLSGNNIIPLSPGSTTATATITYGNMTQQLNVTITVQQRSIVNATSSRIDNQTYTGSAIEPEFTLTLNGKTLVAGTDYTAVYSNNINAGIAGNSARITVTGIGKYTGTTYVYFTIIRRSIDEATLVPAEAPTYTGSDIPLEFTLTYGGATLVANTDYQIYTTSLTNAGTYNITIYGRGNFAETKTVTFTINPRPITDATIAAIPDKTYSGSAFTPVPTLTYGTLTLRNGSDFSLSYSGNVNAGTATVTITGKGNYTGTATTTFVINCRDISAATISPIASQSYTGSEIRPEVTVRYYSTPLTSGTDFTVSYSNNINPGTAVVTITGAGNYAGTKTANFVINAPAPDPDPVDPDPVDPDPVDPDPIIPDDPPAPAGTVNMYRLYNPNSGEHFYTANIAERNNLIIVGWNYEGIGWIAPESSNTPVYRLYNQYGGEHHYTTDIAERDSLIAVGWTYEDIGWYSDDAQTVPLYRQYNPNAFANNHNYTTSLAENNFLASIGWIEEGTGWYGVG